MGLPLLRQLCLRSFLCHLVYGYLFRSLVFPGWIARRFSYFGTRFLSHFDVLRKTFPDEVDFSFYARLGPMDRSLCIDVYSCCQHLAVLPDNDVLIPDRTDSLAYNQGKR